MVKVSFVTPVFNGASFLRSAVESVLRQTHTNWEYVIVNNCSTDGTLQIAEEYARRDRRIRVYSNDVFVNADENHNIAFRYVSGDCKYVKVVAADDWLVDTCVERMIEVAEAHPSVAIVGAYQREGDRVLWKGIPEGTAVLPGRSAARLSLLDGVHILGAPTSVLYRADVVRERRDFFPHTKPHADTDACFEVLKNHDFGFVHEILSFDRLHPAQIRAKVNSLHADALAYIETLMRYGPTFLDKDEYGRRFVELEEFYYNLLGRSVLKLRGPSFWTFHAKEAREIGYSLSISRTLASAAREALKLLRRPSAILTAIRPWQRQSRKETWRS